MTKEEATLSEDLDFIRVEYLQHAEAKWLGKWYLCYHIYLVPEDGALKVAIAFFFGKILSIAENGNENMVEENCTIELPE